MSETGGLNDILAQLSQSAVGTGRRVTAAGAAELREKLLAQIEKTILPRKLTMINDAGERIEIEVVHHRIIRISGAQPEKMMTMDGLIGAALSGDDRNAVIGFNDLLERLVARSTSVEIKSHALQGSVPPGEPGLPIAQVISGPGTQDQVAAPSASQVASKIEDFAAQIKPVTSAWIIIQDGVVTKRHGMTDVIKPLQTYADADLKRLEDKHRSNYPDIRDRGLAVRAQIGDGAQCLIHGWRNDVSILAIGTSKSTPEILAFWAKLDDAAGEKI